jgi:hypothetical protein
MKRFGLVAVVLTVLPVPAAWAQQYIGPSGPASSRPAISPYLNLLRSGQPPGLNYYNLVRPEFEFRGNINQLQAQTTANRQAINTVDTALSTPITGHRSGFMTYGGYFLNNNAQGNLPGRTGAITNPAINRSGTFPGATPPPATRR